MHTPEYYWGISLHCDFRMKKKTLEKEDKKKVHNAQFNNGMIRQKSWSSLAIPWYIPFEHSKYKTLKSNALSWLVRRLSNLFYLVLMASLASWWVSECIVGLGHTAAAATIKTIITIIIRLMILLYHHSATAAAKETWWNHYKRSAIHGNIAYNKKLLNFIL